MDDEKRKQRISQAAQAAIDLSHAVKNLLQAVKGSTDVIDASLQVNDIQRAKKAWKILKLNLERINKLVLDMLAYSKESELILSDCNFNQLLRSAIDTVRPGAQQQQKQINITTDGNIKKVRIDEDGIYDVILNLVLNAIDAVSSKTGVINITTSKEGDKVIIQVSDNGAGIEDANLVFEPFCTTKSKIGTGLGLTIAKKVIELHGGKISLKSAPGKGATFTVTLPANVI